MKEQAMFERYTDRARHVIVLAQEEARELRHDEIGTEHLLLGLIREGEGVAYRALESLGVSHEAIRQQVVTLKGEGDQTPTGHVPFTDRSKKALELALREALQLGHNYIGTEHILLGVIREGEGVASQVLVKSGVSLTQARQHVIQILSGYIPPAPSLLDEEVSDQEESNLALNVSEVKLLERAHERLCASTERYEELLAQSDVLAKHLRDMIREDEKTRDLLRIAIARRE